MLRAFILITTLTFGPGLIGLSARAVTSGLDTWRGVWVFLFWGVFNTVVFVVVAIEPRRRRQAR